MQVSNEELVRISQYVESRAHSDNDSAWVRVDSLAINGRYKATSLLESDDVAMQNEVKRVAAQVAEASDTRDAIVSSLRERIESGTYFVDGDSIAQMMVRRSLADRLR